MNLTLPSFFEDQKSNDIAYKLLDLDSAYQDNLIEAHNLVVSAFQKRWESGRIMYENETYIKDTHGSQGNFAKAIGMSEGVLSNNKRAYKALLEHGCKDWKAVQKLLQDKSLDASVRNFERLPALLNAPEGSVLNQKDQRPKDEKRLEEIYSEAEEILERNNGKNSYVAEKALELAERVEDISNLINLQDPYKSVWQNRKYLDWVKSMGVDMLTGFTCESPDPHHTLPNGGSGGFGKKVADTFVIPVSRETHELIESGSWTPEPIEVAEALIKTLSLFIQTHLPNQA